MTYNMNSSSLIIESTCSMDKDTDNNYAQCNITHKAEVCTPNQCKDCSLNPANN